MTENDIQRQFSELGLPAPILQAVAAVGYETASPIQAATIPALLEGADVLGQAQTGTGKTAAFALPVLAKLDLTQRTPQALVLVPTRELAIQVAEAFQKYASHMPGFHVLPIYGGQSYTPQLNALKRGTHVIVGTPGRVIDHLERGTLSLEGVRQLVLDEADEMLAMGFADAMETILARVPTERQVALFSATMAPEIKRIAQRHLRQPREITIRARTSTGANIRQRYWLVSGLHKLDALTRILEVERFDAMLVFARTKQATMELAERLEARGFAAVALNGDVPQAQRERTIAQLKEGRVDIVVATDVAARGLDVERISHVVNFDVPYDTESYVHRIGRTGRAGRSGDAILFIAPRERNMLRLIERATRQTIDQMTLPTASDVNRVRLQKFRERVTAALATDKLPQLREVVQAVTEETGADLLDVAAAIASLVEGVSLVPAGPEPDARESRERPPVVRDAPAAPLEVDEELPQQTYRLSVGRRNGVLPGNLVGAICNTAGLQGRQINGVDIQYDCSFVRLPGGLSDEVIARLSAVVVRGQPLNLHPVSGAGPEARTPRPHRKGRENGPPRDGGPPRGPRKFKRNAN
jgi:ATP-dependent RNA helicase DeaD